MGRSIEVIKYNPHLVATSNNFDKFEVRDVVQSNADQSQIWINFFVDTSVVNPSKAFNGDASTGAQNQQLGGYITWASLDLISGTINSYSFRYIGHLNYLCCD